MRITADNLYDLLPALYRIRDTEHNETLKKLITILASQGAIVEEDIARLYENWFVETCDEWTVPYLGDLLGVRGLNSIERLSSTGGAAPFSERARVANTLGYRRRKGTAPMLEQLARDVTGWNARAVEFFELTGWTQNYNHVRGAHHQSINARRTEGLELLRTPFDTTSYTIDVRRINSGRGLHNILNVGLFLWRLQSYYVNRSEAREQLDSGGNPVGWYYFNPIGLDVPLINRPQTETEVTHLAEEINVPGLLRRRALYDELEDRRAAKAADVSYQKRFFGDVPVFQILLLDVQGNVSGTVPHEEILICNLEEWHTPPQTKNYAVEGVATPESMPITAAVDPVNGRIAFCRRQKFLTVGE